MNKLEQKRIVEGAPQTPAIWSDTHATLVVSTAPRSPSCALYSAASHRVLSAALRLSCFVIFHAVIQLVCMH
jgi:hypothetical protein